MHRIGFIEAARIIGCTWRSLMVRYKVWGVPYAKIGRMVTFSERELLAWIESKTHNGMGISGDE